MTPTEAIAVLDLVEGRIDAQTEELRGNIAEALNNPAIPMLMRCMAMAICTGHAAQGLLEVGEETPDDLERIHMIDTVPDIVSELRAVADIFEAVHTLRAPPGPAN